jgi:hypothetical protein
VAEAMSNPRNDREKERRDAMKEDHKYLLDLKATQSPKSTTCHEKCRMDRSDTKDEEALRGGEVSRFLGEEERA